MLMSASTGAILTLAALAVWVLARALVWRSGLRVGALRFGRAQGSALPPPDGSLAPTWKRPEAMATLAHDGAVASTGSRADMAPDSLAWLAPLLAALGDASAPAQLYRLDGVAAPKLVCGADTALPAAVAQRLAALVAPDPVDASTPASLAGDDDACGPAQPLAGWRLHVIAGPDGERLALLQPAPPAVPADDAAAFSFTVSHDLRAPLRVVDGFARILKEDYGRQLDRIGNDHVDRIIGAAARMNAMIDAMLGLAKLSTAPVQEVRVDLTAMAWEIAADLQRQDPARSVQWDIGDALAVRGDPTQLRQVMDNLLSNAWKFTARTPAARISFGADGRDGAHCAFAVRDNGAGFDPRSASRLFGLFSRLHSASDFPGTGIGLASVRRIVRRHGGDIVAEGRPGEGASFRFTLAD